MNINEWLDKEVGRSARLAEHFNRTPSAVTQWRTNGVPKEHMKAVRDFTRGEVTLDEMLPELANTTPATAELRATKKEVKAV